MTDDWLQADIKRARTRLIEWGDIPPWTCWRCGKQYDDPADVPDICPQCGEVADDEPE